MDGGWGGALPCVFAAVRQFALTPPAKRNTATGGLWFRFCVRRHFGIIATKTPRQCAGEFAEVATKRASA